VSGISGFVDISSLVPPPVDSANRGSGRGEEPSGEILRLIQIRLATLSFEKSRPVVKQETRNPTRRFEFHKRSQLIIRMHDEPLSVIPMRVNDPDRSPVGIDR
jgi:hypothetical protein